MKTTRGGAAFSPAARTLAIVLAGGNGTRLGELTRWHAKPALPFAGQYRNIDFTLSNCVNSGTRRIAVLTQYKAHSLIQHIRRGWSFLPAETGEFIEIWPAQQRRGNAWYGGTADAVYQNLDLIDAHGPEYVLVLAGDHIYKMDYVRMLAAHAQAGADVTVGCVEVPLAEASSFGVVEIDTSNRIRRFDEKPKRPQPMQLRADCALASMGIYVFNRHLLSDYLTQDAADPVSRHDFGRDILPRLLAGGTRMQAHLFRDPATGRSAYWRDVGTVENYWRAHMDLLADQPRIDLNDDTWPIRTDRPRTPPVRFVGQGHARRSIVSGGCIVGGCLDRSVLSMNCRVMRGAVVESSVLLPNVEIGSGCLISGAVIGPGCRIPDGSIIGRSLVPGLPFDDTMSSRVTLVTDEGLARKTRPVAHLPAGFSADMPHLRAADNTGHGRDFARNDLHIVGRAGKKSMETG